MRTRCGGLYRCCWTYTLLISTHKDLYLPDLGTQSLLPDYSCFSTFSSICVRKICSNFILAEFYYFVNLDNYRGDDYCVFMSPSQGHRLGSNNNLQVGEAWLIFYNYVYQNFALPFSLLCKWWTVPNTMNTSLLYKLGNWIPLHFT